MMTAALLCMALNVYHEARGEPWWGQVAVAHVVMNRVADSRWEPSICAVIAKKSQFSWTSVASGAPKDTEALETAIKVARLVARGNYPDPTHGATHYHAITVNPEWAARLTETVRIGNHVFYR